MLRLLAAATVMALPALALAQTGGLESNKYMKYDDPKDWIVRYRYMVFPDMKRVGSNGVRGRVTLDYPSFTAVAPYITDSGAATLTDSVQSSLRANLWFDQSQNSMASGSFPTVRAPGSPAPYIRLSVSQPVSFVVADIVVAARITAYDTEFDEKAAWDLPWPETVPSSVAGWLQHDAVYDTPAEDGADAVQALLEKWTGGNDPKQVPPVQLAKYLTGQVLAHVRTRGPKLQSPVGFSTAVVGGHPGNSIQAASMSGVIGGFPVKNAAEVAATRIGSEHDVSNLLTAVLRRAGLPARTIIGIDDEENGDDKVKSWVEVAIVAPDLDAPLWIPIDVMELKDDGRNGNNWQQPWKHFGTSDLLRHTPPVAYHFHPPADYKAYNHPSLCGIQSTGELPGIGSQAINFDVWTAPKYADGRSPFD